MKYEQILGRSLHDAMTRAKEVLGNDIVLMRSETLNPNDPGYDEDRTTRITVGVVVKEEGTNQQMLDAYRFHTDDADRSTLAGMDSDSGVTYQSTEMIENHSNSRPAGSPELNRLYNKIDQLQSLVSRVLRLGFH